MKPSKYSLKQYLMLKKLDKCLHLLRPLHQAFLHTLLLHQLNAPWIECNWNANNMSNKVIMNVQD